MNSLLTLAKDLEQKSKVQQQTTGEMLKAAFSEHEKSVRAELSESEENQRRHPRPRPEAVLSHEASARRDAADGQPDVADHRHSGVRAADRFERGHSVVARVSRCSTITTIREQKKARRLCCRAEQRRAALDLRRSETPLREVNPEAGRFGEDSSWMILAGK
ncbi:MbeB family mobilization protein [Pantoea stewartii]|uniref:MbeB family mobilization protein n=1 Tax=Pantoea stewartii TaxID=66269 RepID=UPI0025A034A1|nr:MbeB family mobilization protein [Pantoea stewartii]